MARFEIWVQRDGKPAYRSAHEDEGEAERMAIESAQSGEVEAVALVENIDNEKRPLQKWVRCK